MNNSGGMNYLNDVTFSMFLIFLHGFICFNMFQNKRNLFLSYVLQFLALFE